MDDDAVLSVLCPPAPALRALVDGYQGYRAPPRVGAPHRGLPSGTLTLVITLDEPITLHTSPDSLSTGGRFEALVGGLHSRPALMNWDAVQTGVQLGVTPLGARRLLGLPAGELTETVVSVQDLWGRRGEQLIDQLRDAPHWRARFTLLDAWLVNRLDDDCPAPSPEVARAWASLTTYQGNRRITDLAREVGWSRRHLSARFANEIGLSPRTAGRVLRFDAARRSLSADARAGGVRRLADVAAVHGYADQAHFAREFRALAGCPPSQWLVEEGLAN